MQKHLNLGSDVRRLLLAILIGNLLSAVFAAAQQPDPVIALESQLRSTGLAPLPDFDSRRASRAEISTARRQLAREFERRLGGGMDVKFDTRTGGIHHLFGPTVPIGQPRSSGARLY